MKAEACLVRSVKLEPSLVSGWNELGESYMRKHDWTTARTCFEVSNNYHIKERCEAQSENHCTAILVG